MTPPTTVIESLQVGSERTGDALLRVLLLVYLVDWKGALESGHQISSARWKKQAWGAFSESVLEALMHGKKVEPGNGSSLSPAESAIIQQIKERYSSRSFSELRDLVASTYPMIVKSLGDELDLQDLAAHYRQDFSEERQRALA